MSLARKHAAALARAAALACAAACAATCSLTGCGTPGSPLPPSLNLPARVTDLAATRAGNQVTLTWTMPRRTTDRILLKDPLTVRACWSDANAQCIAAGQKPFAPRLAATWTEPLPAPLLSGPPRPVRLYVEVINRNQRSAGLSDPAVILAGAAPAPVESLAAEPRKTGVALHWTAGDPQNAVRLHRTLLTPPEKKKDEGLLAAPREPITQDLLVDHDTGLALDKNIRVGQSYEYRAQRVARIESDGQMRELAGELSSPVRVDVRDIFPPAAPAGHAAVATSPTGGAPAFIDLSWQPDAESDVAGYFVYRREQQTPWQRISGDKPLVGPAFHDPDVQPGHTYIYSVIAVDTRGNQSPRSADASDTVPQQ